MSLHKITLIALSTLCIGILHAEVNPYDGYTVNFGNSTHPAAQMGDAFRSSAIADPIFNNLRQDENQVQYDTTNEVAGREYKSNDATKQGNAGTVGAILTGSALVATGTPMLFSPFLPVVLAGADLIAKGAMEFAQAGADAGASGANDAQYQTLMTGSPSQRAIDAGDTQRKIAEQIGTPELRQMLTERGVDAEDFIQNLASGNMQNPMDVLKSVGNNSEFSQDDFAQGQALAATEFGKISGARLHNDEGNDVLAGNGGLGMGGFGAGGLSSGKPSAEELASGNVASLSPGRPIAGKVPGSITESGGEMKMLGTGINPNAVVANIFGNKPGADGKALDAATRNALFSAGVQRTTKGQNIFSLAKRTFRTFHKYRKTKGVKHASRS